MNRAAILLNDAKEIKAKIKELSDNLHIKTKHRIEKIEETEIKELLNKKWIAPVLDGISGLAYQLLDKLSKDIIQLNRKYEVTYSQVAKEIEATEKDLSNFITQLDGNEYDLRGLNEFQLFLKGDWYE